MTAAIFACMRYLGSGVLRLVENMAVDIRSETARRRWYFIRPFLELFAVGSARYPVLSTELSYHSNTAIPRTSFLSAGVRERRVCWLVLNRPLSTAMLPISRKLGTNQAENFPHGRPDDHLFCISGTNRAPVRPLAPDPRRCGAVSLVPTGANTKGRNHTEPGRAYWRHDLDDGKCQVMGQVFYYDIDAMRHTAVFCCRARSGDSLGTYAGWGTGSGSGDRGGSDGSGAGRYPLTLHR